MGSIKETLDAVVSKKPANMHDLLMTMHNYFLEADGTHVRLTPAHDSLPEIAGMDIELGQAFSNFALDIASLTLTPADGYDTDDIIEEAAGITMDAYTDTDGVEKLKINLI